MPADSLLYEVVIFGFLIGLSGGAISFYAVHRLMTLMTVASLLLPITIMFLPSGEHILLGMALGAIIFFVSAMRSVKLISLSFHQNFVLTCELKKSRDIAEKLARKDVLTGLNNRRAFYEQAEVLANHSERYNDTFTAIFIDLDYFKKINDTFGHAAGDAALVQVADILKKRSRESDFIARIGGEEFAILMHSSSIKDGESLAEDLRRTIEASAISYDGQNLSITASFGIAQFDSDIDSLFSRADDALYQAKEAGRNRIVCDTQERNLFKRADASRKVSN